MKKRMILAASFMAAVALTSCSNNDFVEEEPVGSAQLVEIQVGQAVEGLATKAAVSKGDQVIATIIASKGAITDPATFWPAFVPVTENTFVVNDEWNATTFANVSVGTFEAGTNAKVGLRDCAKTQSSPRAFFDILK